MKNCAKSALVAAVTAVAATVLAGCTIGDVSEKIDGAAPQTVDGGPSPAIPAPTLSGQTQAPSEVVAASSSAVEPNAGDVQQVLEGIVADVQGRYQGTVGIAVAGAQQVFSAGVTSPVTAWSTSKVPVAIAAERAGVAAPAAVSQAITYSDNAAAESLWAALGSGTQAAAAAEAVLADAGLSLTVPAEATRPGFSAFGQTQWSVPDQARFAGQLGCVDGAAAVLSAMAVADPAQSYGLGTVAGASKKGGWGPDAAGAYEARQMGLVTLGGTKVAVALYAKSATGSYGDAQAMLTALVEGMIAAEAAEMQWPAAAC